MNQNFDRLEVRVMRDEFSQLGESLRREMEKRYE